ncbi:MAG: sacsin N-terminal ATP-binding-like domain-containing protein [Acidothermaceae bacterium]
MRARVLDAWTASPARFREDANAEEDLVLGGYRDRVVVELAQNAADAASRAGVRGRLQLSLRHGVLRVANTGALLDAAGVESTSTLRASSKRADGAGGAGGAGGSAGATGVVGRFGVGFAAVLAVSDEPAIISRTGAVAWSRERTIGEVSKIPGLKEELARRDGAVPVLRLPYPDESGREPAAGFDTEVVLGLRDAAAEDLVRELLDGVDAALLLSLPALAEVEVVIDGVTRRLVADPTPNGVVVDGARWVMHRVTGRIDPALLHDRPVEERASRQFSLTWAVPVDDAGAPLPLPASVPPVAHAPTPTDELLSLPALLIAPLPLDPMRRHVASGALRDYLVEQAASGYVDLIREMPGVPEVLALVPVGVAAGALDGELRALILGKLGDTAFLGSHDEGVRLRPSQALVLDDAGVVVDDELLTVLGEVIPAVLPARWVRAGQTALGALDVRRVALAAVVDELATLQKPPAWWHSLYAALAQAQIGRDSLEGLPVPLASGGLARSPRGLLMPGRFGELDVLGLRGIDADAAHPLLVRLGAVEPEPIAILTDERVRAAVENSYDADDTEAIADAVLGLVAASGVTVFDEPWLAELALPDTDGELVAAGELLLPKGNLAELLVDDSPFGVVAAGLIERWGVETLAAVGVVDGFALVRATDVTDAEHDLDGEAEYLQWVSNLIDGDEPIVIDELVAVRDLELVRPDAWPAALQLLGRPPLRGAVVEPAIASTSATRLRTLSYTAWWLRRSRIAVGRLASSGPLLEGLYDVVQIDLDDEFLTVIGAVRDVSDVDADDLVARLGDPARAVTREQARKLYASIEPNRPPSRVRAIVDGALVVVQADDAVIVDQPDLLPLLGNLGVVPVPLSDALRVADVLDIALAAELGEFPVVSKGESRGDHVVHSPLLVADVDDVETNVAWRLVDGVLHVDAEQLAFGLGRGRAWRSGDWSRRHLETELIRRPELAAVLLDEGDLDPLH